MTINQAFSKPLIAWTSSQFKEWFGDMEFNAKKKVKKLISTKLTRAMTDQQIFDEFHPTECSLEEVLATLKTLDKFTWCIFYCKDKVGVLRAVGVCWRARGDGWYVIACLVTRPFEWFDDSRVFSRNSRGTKALGTSDTLTLEPSVPSAFDATTIEGRLRALEDFQIVAKHHVVSDRAPKEVLERGTMEVVIKDLKNIMFWADYGLGKARNGSAIEETIAAIKSYSEYLGYGQTKNIKLGRYLK